MMKLLRVSKYVISVTVVCLIAVSPAVCALGSQQNPQSGTLGLEATVPGTPPTQAATISVPVNGQVVTSIPITIAGLCKSGLLVKVFSNNVFIGSAQCINNSFSLQADLFSGRNDLVARVYDTLDQAGPDSNVVTVTFNSAQYATFGTQLTLTSNYARRGADPGSQLTWPFILSGGFGPYAVSIDWGDGNTDLKSLSFPGVFNANHTYNQSGVYNIVVKATDANNTSAYLQVVGIANGKVSGSLTTGGGSANSSNPPKILWQPVIAAIPLLLVAFWLGQKHELYSIRRTIEATRNEG